MRQAGALGRQVRSARTQVQQLEQAVAREAMLREQYQQVSQAVVGIQEALPAEEQLPLVIERLSHLARQTQVRIHTIFPQRPTNGHRAREREKAPSGPSTYQDFRIEIDAAAGYHQLGVFLSQIESETQPIRLASLRILTDPKDPRRHRVHLVIRCYFAASGVPAVGASS
jgi:Tfp pilus assembly protein PilO